MLRNNAIYIDKKYFTSSFLEYNLSIIICFNVYIAKKDD